MDTPPAEGFSIDDNDRKEIIRLILAGPDSIETIPDIRMQGDLQGLIVSTQYIDADWLPKIEGFKLLPMTKEEIQNKADKEGDFLYLSFGEFKLEGETVKTSINNTWAVGKNSKNFYLSGGGKVYTAYKKDGKWMVEQTGYWIS